MSNDIDLTPEQARKNVEAHEKQHGRDMKAPPGQDKANDHVTQEMADAEPGWAKHGGKLEDQPEE